MALKSNAHVFLRIAILAFSLSTASCQTVSQFDRSYSDAIHKTPVFPADTDQADAVGMLRTCMDTVSAGDWHKERQELLASLFADHSRHWDNHILIESMGTGYLSYNYSFIGLGEHDSLVIIKDWKHSESPLVKTLTGGDMGIVRTLFSQFQDDIEQPMLPMRESYSMHPACFFISLNLYGKIYQYAIWDPVFDSSSPPLLLLDNAYNFSKTLTK